MKPEEIAKELRKMAAPGGTTNKSLEHKDFILLHSAANLIERLVAESEKTHSHDET